MRVVAWLQQIRGEQCGLRVGPGSYRLPWPALFYAGLAVAVYFLAGPAPDGLVFDRLAIGQGEIWRLVTGHWVHSDVQHALWDIAALFVLGALPTTRRDPPLGLVLFAGIAAVDLWLWFGMPELQRYCGLSGILNTVLVLRLASLWRQTRRPIVGWIALVATAKVVVEIATQQALFTTTAWPSVPTAHAAGFAAGLGLVALSWSARAGGIPALDESVRNRRSGQRRASEPRGYRPSGKRRPLSIGDSASPTNRSPSPVDSPW